MRAMPSLTSRTVPTSSTSSSWRSAASISRRRMSLISPGRRVVSDAMGSDERWEGQRTAAVQLVNFITSLHPLQADAPGGNEMVVRDGSAARTFPAMTPGLRDLKVWQESVALGGEVARVVQ